MPFILLPALDMSTKQKESFNHTTKVLFVICLALIIAFLLKVHMTDQKIVSFQVLLKKRCLTSSEQTHTPTSGKTTNCSISKAFPIPIVSVSKIRCKDLASIFNLYDKAYDIDELWQMLLRLILLGCIVSEICHNWLSRVSKDL